MKNRYNKYMRKEVWLKIQQEYQPSEMYTEKGNKMYKETIDRIVDSFAGSTKEDFITNANN